MRQVQNAGHRNQKIECDHAGNGQEIFFQIDGAQHQQKACAQVRQLFGDGGSRIAGKQRNSGGGCGGGRGQFQHRGLLFIQRSNGVGVELGRGCDPR